MKIKGIDNIADSLSPLDLAFLGDSVYSLLVRKEIVKGGSRPVGEMHKMAVEYVCAKSQSMSFDKIEQYLTNEELAVYKRGRNTSGVKPPKNTTTAEYHKATGLEAMFGWLFLKNRIERIDEIFSLIINIDQNQEYKNENEEKTMGKT